MNPDEILEAAFQQAWTTLNVRNSDIAIAERIDLIGRNLQNRACSRLILACTLAKIHNPRVDIRKPYTQIGDADTFSGRTYDEGYITKFISEHQLPCNSTTAFLTPALRNINQVLTPTRNLVGRPREVYRAALELLSDVYTEKLSAADLMLATLRILIIVRDEKQARIDSLLAGLQVSIEDVSLSAEEIMILIQQHLATKGASRLPVLIIAALYQVASIHLGEQALALESHNAADKQTEALGDIQITLLDNHKMIVTTQV